MILEEIPAKSGKPLVSTGEDTALPLVDIKAAALPWVGLFKNWVRLRASHVNGVWY